MQTLTVEAAQDHFDRLSKTKKPVLGLAQLTWNAKKVKRRREVHPNTRRKNELERPVAVAAS